MDFSAFKEIINKVNSVINCKIITENDSIIEVHVIANTLRSGKQIARDIESSLLVNFDYRIDRSKLSIAQIQTGDYKEIKRIKFEGMSIKTCDNTLECNITLSYEDEEYTSTQTGINITSSRMKTIANTTLKAIEKIFDRDTLLDIVDVFLYKYNDISFVCVLVNLILEGHAEILSGSAIVKDDKNEAIVKATLDAVNRRTQKI